MKDLFNWLFSVATLATLGVTVTIIVDCLIKGSNFTIWIVLASVELHIWIYYIRKVLNIK